jgi:hypothetical protein
MKITVSYCSLLAILFSIIACGKEFDGIDGMDKIDGIDGMDKIDGIEKIDKIGGMVFI